MNFEQICNWVVLISAVCLAITNIFKFFGKPIGLFKKKQDEELNAKIDTRINAILPEKLDERDQATREKYLKQRMNYLNEIQTEVQNNMAAPLKTLADAQQTLNQTQQEIKNSLEVLKQGTKDVLRQKIMAIYHEYKNERAFPIFAKEALDELYKDYKHEGGNSYIDKYYSRMVNWEVTYPDDDTDY